MTTTFITRRRVEFCETDLAGIVHFANFYRYMEQAEHEWFRSLGLKIHGTLPDGTVFGWPRVAASCSFRSPARYDDEIEVRVTVLRLTPIGGHLRSTDIPNEYAERLGEGTAQ